MARSCVGGFGPVTPAIFRHFLRVKKGTDCVLFVRISLFPPPPFPTFMVFGWKIEVYSHIRFCMRDILDSEYIPMIVTDRDSRTGSGLRPRWHFEFQGAREMASEGLCYLADPTAPRFQPSDAAAGPASRSGLVDGAWQQTADPDKGSGERAARGRPVLRSSLSGSHQHGCSQLSLHADTSCGGVPR